MFCLFRLPAAVAGGPVRREVAVAASGLFGNQTVLERDAKGAPRIQRLRPMFITGLYPAA